MRIGIVDDSALFREGLAALLTQAGIEVSVLAASGEELYEAIEGCLPDAIVLDIRMPPTFNDEGIVIAAQLKNRHPRLGVLVLSAHIEATYVERLLGGGTSGIGYMLKDRVDNIDSLKSALTRVASGGLVVDDELIGLLLRRQKRRASRQLIEQFTERELAVLQLMAEGYSNAGISERLGMAVKTVESYVASIFRGLDIAGAPETNRRVLAVLEWLRSDASSTAGMD